MPLNTNGYDPYYFLDKVGQEAYIVQHYANKYTKNKSGNEADGDELR